MILLRRLFAWLVALIVWLDEGLSIVVRGPIYLMTGYNMPSAHETISAWVGECARLGQPWAIDAARVLDAVLGKKHCANADLFERSIETPAA